MFIYTSRNLVSEVRACADQKVVKLKASDGIYSAQQDSRIGLALQFSVASHFPRRTLTHTFAALAMSVRHLHFLQPFERASQQVSNI